LLATRASRSPRAGVGLLIFVLLAVALLFYVKWDPLFQKALKAAATHTLGPSIVSGRSAAPPAISVGAALHYALAYFEDIWQALVAGLLLGSAIQVLVPRDWLLRLLGRAGARSALIATAAAVPSMMCTCCSAPLVVGLRRQEVSPGAALAYWIGNPVLNPATIVFIGFVLGWRWALLRIVMGLLLVAGAAWLGNRHASTSRLDEARVSLPQVPLDDGPLFLAWGRALLRLLVGLVPEYVVIVLALGALRAVLFPAVSPAIGDGVLLFLGLTVAGTLFVIPTAGEVPILQTLLSFGLGPLAAGSLLLTLPAVSLPSLAMVGRAFPVRLLAEVALLVAVSGLLTGLLALGFHV
jgi:uncharacterized membrane protein YraQ (UPF0718 family)